MDGNNRFIDDYIKIFKKISKLKGILKYSGRLGLIVGAVLFFSPTVTVEQILEKGCFRVTTENVVTKAG
jgi:hypothetical protein